MANMSQVFDIMMKLEFNSPANALHKNKTESGWTFMGIYQTAHPKLKMWTKIEVVVSRMGNVANASKVLYSDKELLKEVEDFYKKTFWDRMWLDKVVSQHKANEMFVFGVNAGISRSVRLAQIVSGAVADGLIGPKTIEAINKCDDKVFDVKFDEEEIKYYEAIVRSNPNKGIFLNGWKNRALAI